MMRDRANPIITADDVPAFHPAMRDLTSVFNPGAVRHDGYDLLVLRAQTRGRETVLVPAAAHDDGSVDFFEGIASIDGLDGYHEKIHHVYDPRLTRIDDVVYMVFAVDVTSEDGSGACRLGVARMRSPTAWELLGIDGSRDSRNGVLFPMQQEDKYFRLERPNTTPLSGGPMTGSEIRIAHSTDLVSWALGDVLMTGRKHYWDELIGPGPPPILTERGWLLVYHGVATHFASSNIYQAGVCLLDKDDPSILLSRGAMNFLEPREPYELVGQVPNVVFPSGLAQDENDERSVRIYYGCADTSVGRLHTTVDELISCCDEPGISIGR